MPILDKQVTKEWSYRFQEQFSKIRIGQYLPAATSTLTRTTWMNLQEMSQDFMARIGGISHLIQKTIISSSKGIRLAWFAGLHMMVSILLLILITMALNTL